MAATSTAVTRRPSIPKRLLTTTTSTAHPPPRFISLPTRRHFTSIRCCRCAGNSTPHSPLISNEKGQISSPKYNLLVQRRRRREGPTYFELNYYYYSELSAEENFSPKDDVYLPFFEITLNSHQFAGSCNGILCFSDSHTKVVLWNPSTNDFKFLPESSGPRPPFTDIIYTSSIGFGFDPKSKDYKVIRTIVIFLEDEEGEDLGNERQIELYSLEKNSWKEISLPEHFPLFVFPAPKYPTYIDGVYYWRQYNYWGWGEKEKLILSFDLASEEFALLPFPDIKRSYTFNLMECDGLLCIIAYSEMGVEKSLEFWLYKNGSWTIESIFHTCGVENPVGFWKNGQVMFLLSLDHELLMFDRATGVVKNLGIHEHPTEMQKLIPYVPFYVENQSFEVNAF